MPQRVDRSFRKDPGRGCAQLYFLPRPAREGQASLEAGPVGRLGTINRRRKVTDEDGMVTPEGERHLRLMDSSWKCNRIVEQHGGISSSPFVQRHLSFFSPSRWEGD